MYKFNVHVLYLFTAILKQNKQLLSILLDADDRNGRSR
jgi:hypothetical protein